MFDLESHLRRQMAFSRGNFGPGERRKGVTAHIKKELDEEIATAATADEAAREWGDVVLLGLDGCARALVEAGYRWDAIPRMICEILNQKQGYNEQRIWPDWRTLPEDAPIEHVREGA